MKITALKGIGPKKSKDLKKLGIVDVSDLYNYYPKSYEDRSKLKKLANATDNRKCYFEWKIVSRLFTKYINSGRKFSKKEKKIIEEVLISQSNQKG